MFGICKSKTNWSTDHQKKTLIKNVQNQIGNKKIICALSGGVDSSVVAQLLNKAVGKQLHCIFVNTGLLVVNDGSPFNNNPVLTNKLDFTKARS